MSDAVLFVLKKMTEGKSRPDQSVRNVEKVKRLQNAHVRKSERSLEERKIIPKVSASITKFLGKKCLVEGLK